MTPQAMFRATLLVGTMLALGCSSSPSFAPSASGGAAGTGGSAAGGAGGATGSDAGLACPACSAGEYCQASTGKCVGCGDLTELSFGAPQPLAGVNGNPLGGLRFPRVAGADGGTLVYVSNNTAMQPAGHRLWFTATPDTAYGTAISDTSVSASAPLYVKFDFITGTMTDFLFDRVETPGQASGPRDLYAAQLTAGKAPGAAALPGPFNAAGGADDYSIAVAPDLHRAWWMSDRGGQGRRLLTFSWTPMGTPQPVDLTVQVDPQHSCPRAGDDATPWVTPDGRVMLFSATRLTADCHPADSGKRGLYWIRLDASNGRPAAGATGQPLASLEPAGTDATDPSLSADLCTLYYAADDGKGFKLYRAQRR